MKFPVERILATASGVLILTTLGLAAPLPEPAGLITTASGLRYAVAVHGQGPQPQAGQVVVYHYRGTLADGTVFDSSFDRKQPFAFTLGRQQVIKGVEEAFQYFRVGDQGTMILPANLAYGDKPRDKIPPNSTLRFDIEVLEVKDHGLADILGDALNQGGVEAARKRFEELKAAGFGEVYVNEDQLNLLGYRNLTKGKLTEAVAVLEWNAELFPASANVYDSLAEALWKSGRREEAVRNYERSLALDPKNENAVKMLARIRAQPTAGVGKPPS